MSKNLDFYKTMLQSEGGFPTGGLTLAEVNEIVTDIGLSPHEVKFHSNGLNFYALLEVIEEQSQDFNLAEAEDH